MTDSDYTLTSPLFIDEEAGAPILTLTVLWHPDAQRIGEQVFAPDPRVVLEVSRFLPLFGRPGRAPIALGHQGISRQPLCIGRSADGGLTVQAPASRMTVEVNGAVLDGTVALTAAQVAAGAVLGLGRAILLCLHFSDRLPRANPVPGMVGVGSSAIRMRDLVRTAAATELPVLLLGETGTGKEVAAAAIHALSRRAQAPLVAVNMAVLSETLAAAELFGAARGAYTGADQARTGLFAQAQDATLFLDEIGNTPPAVQPMLLRVLESGQYRAVGATTERRSNARVIAATDQDLDSADFNQALRRRLENIVIALPPLRARREDIGVLIVHLLEKLRRPGAPATTLPFAFVSACANDAWPGNVRQLAHVLAQAMLAIAAGGTPQFPVRSQFDIPAPAPVLAPARRRTLADVDGNAVLAALHRHGWQIRGAAETLGISRPSLYKLIAAHPAIRPLDAISADEIREHLDRAGGDLMQCAAALQTPLEGLRRHLRGLQLTDASAMKRYGTAPLPTWVSGSKVKTR